MKILAVRGRNLASLADRFELDFTAEPLVGAGLFTIIGETGAGKSTILDALCLALYGVFPRLRHGEGSDKLTDAAGDEIEVHDPRSILRIGAVDAFAEAELEIGGVHLLARWQVRRARGRPDGKLQPAERTLRDVSNDTTIASGKTNVETEIVTRLGLTYDQFKRTVLLAQNQFDAFLAASDSDRAELLERITGTEIYSRLSRAAFEAAKAAQQQVEELQRDEKAIAVLDEAARTLLAADLTEADKRRAVIEGEAAELRRILDVHARAEEAAKRAAEAKAAETQAAEALEAAAAERQLLARLQQMEPLRGLIRQAADAGAGCAALEDQLGAEQQEAETRRLRQSELAEKLAAGEQQLKAAETEAKRRAPLVEAALDLDRQIAAAKTSAEDLAQQKEAAAQAAAAAERELATLDAELAALAENREALTQELEQRSGYAPLASQSGELETAFAGLAEQMGAALAARETLARLRREQDAQVARSENDEARRRQLLEKLVAARKQEREKGELLAALRPAEARAKRDQLAWLADDLAELTRHLEAEAERRTALAEQEATAVEAGEALAAREGDIERLAARLAEAEARARETEASLTRSSAIVSAEVMRLRADLADGEACPVCGAHDHPGHDDALAHKLVEDLRRRRAELAAEKAVADEQLAGARAEVAGLKARRQAALAEAEASRARLAAIETERAPLVDRTARAAKKVFGKAVSVELATLGNVRQLDETIRKLRAELVTTLEKAMVLEAERQRASERMLAFDSELAIGTDAMEAATASLQRLAADTAAAEKTEALAAARRDATLDQLSTRLIACSFSRDDLLRDAKGVGRRVSSELAAYNDLVRKRQQLEVTSGELQPKCAALAERGDQLAGRSRDAESRCSAAEKALAELSAKRATVLDGRPAAAVRDEAAKTLETARAEVAEAALAGRELAASLDELHKAMEKQRLLLQRRGDEARRFETERDTKLAKAGLSAADAAELLAISEEDRAARQQRMKALEDAFAHATAQALDRTRLAGETASAREGLPQANESRERLAALLAEQTSLSERLGRDRQRLAADDEARKKHGDLARRIEKAVAEKQKLAAINEAIGSADGARFRRFAQGVTLDHLVALANEQLRGINPRYEIERSAEGGLALQVVDLEMGGERRSVRSLSGGERFLVSLALALSLSRLDGGRAYVDTLLIDEGFGALDARSLDMAVEALERLQSEGRRVGVISHVEALKERIPVQVLVEKQGDGRSRVRVGTPAYGF